VRGFAPTLVDRWSALASEHTGPGLDKMQVKVMARGWTHGKAETPCGPGSMMARTENIRAVLPVWLERYQIKTLVDAGAGDMNWIKSMPMPGVEYKPFDIVVRDDAVSPIDITVQRLPKCDAILCRHVLNHLTEEQVLAALRLMKKVTNHLILTNMPGSDPRPRAFGHFIDYDLRVAPFNLGEPLESVEDCKGTWISLWERK
jgi:hypothetical protein